MRSASRIGSTAILLLLSVISISASEYVFDSEEPDVKDRVARISFIKGDVQIKRADSDQWEKAVLNLPVVAGDEITTAADARIEIQFGAYSLLRVAERSTLRILTLKYGLAVVGLPEGGLALTLSRFDPASDAFEIDAPRTTVAVQKAGRYRVDAGPTGYEALRISIPGEGEARVYSNNSGFTLNEGRSARVFVSGRFTGEWETGDAAQYADNFDQWSVERDDAIAKRQAQAYYGKYYDTDIYGADDLNDHGQWTNTFDYGWIWRPDTSAIAGYADWSPYRYGAWRWVTGFGWSWVNDEPWGWATYHHGRWIWYNGAWYWAPYGYYRQSRSWWYPALVVLQQFNRSICWYPLPHRGRYRNFNRQRDRDRNTQAVTGGRNFVITPVQISGDVSVISVPVDIFGKTNGGYTKLPPMTGREVVSKEVADEDVPVLPIYRDISAKVSHEIRVSAPREQLRVASTTVGASKREAGEPLDKGLRENIIFGNRRPVTTKTESTDEGKEVGKRPTGPVVRTEPKTTESDQTILRPMVVQPAPRQSDSKSEAPKRDAPIYVPRERSESPPQKSEPKSESPKSEPKSESPRKSEPPPQRSEPKSEPSKRSDPPPQRSESPRAESSRSSDSSNKKP